MIDNLMTHAVSGNKAHKSKLEAVRLQIVALRAIEAQLLEWIAQGEKEKAAEEDWSNPSKELMRQVAQAMADRGLTRADHQSPQWAGLAVHGLAFGEITPQQRKQARRVIEAMARSGIIRKVSEFSGRRGREIPSYQVCDLPTCESSGGKSGEEWGKS